MAELSGRPQVPQSLAHQIGEALPRTGNADRQRPVDVEEQIFPFHATGRDEVSDICAVPPENAAQTRQEPPCKFNMV